MGNRSKQCGLILVSAIALVVFLTILGSSFLLRGLHESQTSQMSRALYRATFFAESSIDTAIRNLRSSDASNVPSTPMLDGSFWAEVSPSGTLEYLVIGHGLNAGQQRNLEARIRLTPTSVFQFALFGSQQIRVSGSAVTDSFNSALGSYASQTAGSDGDIGTNATTPGGVTIDGSIAINGQIAVGAGASDPNSVVVITGGSALITGVPPVVPLTQTMPTSSVSVPAGLTCTDLSIAGQTTMTLSSAVGAYCFRNVNLTGGSTLTADGPVKIYVTGTFSVSGNTTIGIPTNPPAMVVEMVSNQELTLQSDLTGSTKFYGGIYAPTGTIDITGHAEVYGSIIAKQVEVSGSAQVHYDQAIGSLIEPLGLYKANILSWREL